LGRILGLNGHMLVQSVSGPLEDFDTLAGTVAAMGGVTRAAPIVEGQVMVSSGDLVSGALVRGMRGQDLASLPLVAQNITRGSLEDFGTAEAVTMGGRLALRLGLSVGDTVTLIAPQGAATPFGTAPRIKSYRIAALFEVGMAEYDSSFLFMPLEEAQLFFNTGAGVSAIEVMVDDPDEINAYRTAAFEILPPNIRIVDWQQVNSSFFGALQVERNVMFLILTLIIIVASLNIISGLVMLVKDKSKDIAILRTMGASRSTILRVFFLVGASVGVIGTLAGFALGVVFCANIEAVRQFISALTGTELFPPEVYFLSQLPAEIDNGEVAAVVIMALLLSFLSPLYPSWRAARLDPVEALRYE
jgi:lipoprotein-releasing system permease protein